MTSRREELHRALDVFCDAEERAAAINDEDEAAGAREEVFEKLKPLINLLGRDILRERMGSMRIPLPVYPTGPKNIVFSQTGSKHSKEAVEAGNIPAADVNDPTYMDHWQNAYERQMLISFLIDMQDLLVENLAHKAVVALWKLNCGDVDPFLSPLVYEGMPNPLDRHIKDAFIAHIYYKQGFHNLRRRDAIDKVNEENPDADRPLKEGTIDQWLERYDLKPNAAFYKELGRQDALANRPERVPGAPGRYSPFKIEELLARPLLRNE
ncbi:hypothetical protein KIH24_05690 [Rhizobiales bacterium TNE-4]|nr:hypothetical protein [Rhizobiales bacterium TNE-4]MBV1827115.1 hypothetical protein [Rhizobiales bacterium TNE-4]